MIKNRISNSWLANTAIFHLTLILGEYVEQFLFVLHTPVQDMLICIYTHIQYVYRYIRLPLSRYTHTCAYDKHIDTSWMDSTASCRSFFILPRTSGIRGLWDVYWDTPSFGCGESI